MHRRALLKVMHSIVVAASAVLLMLGSARGQTPDAPTSPASDAGAPPDSAPPAGETPATPPDVAPAPPATSSPAPAAIILPGTMVDVVPAPSTDGPAPPSFGRRGQIVILGGSDIGLSSSTFDASSATHASYVFSPDLAYFVARNVSLGISLGATYAQSKGYGADGSLVDTRTTTVQVRPRFGLNLPLGELFSWFPQVTVGFEWTRRTEQLVTGASLSIPASALGYPTTTQFGPYINVYAPVLLHATDHFFVGFGPTFFHDFGSVSGGPNIGGQRTDISADFVVGGYWGGEPAPAATPARTTSPPPRFGNAGQFVLMNDLALSVSSQTYAGDSTARSVTIGGSLDYFVIDHVSVGLAAGISSSYSRGIDATTAAPVTTSSGGVTVSPRLGLNVALDSSLSVYPQFAIGVGHQAVDETSGASESKEVADLLTVSLFVPLLVHPAPHVFVGLGPSVQHDVSRAVTFPEDPLAPAVQNRQTTLGAGLVIGGWL